MDAEDKPSPRHSGSSGGGGCVMPCFYPTVESGIGCCCDNRDQVQQQEALIQRIVSALSENSIVETVRSMRSGASPRSWRSPKGIQPVASSILVTNESARNWKGAILAIIGLVALTVVLPTAVLRIATRDRTGVENSASNATGHSSGWSFWPPRKPRDPFAHESWDIMDIKLGEDIEDVTSLSISADGTVLVVASASRFSVMEVDTDNSVWTVSYSEVLPIGNGQPIVELSGDGSTVFLGATNTSLPILVWRAEDGWKQSLVPRSSIQLRQYMEEEPSYLLVDIAASYDGQTCFVGYGNEATEELLYYENQTVFTMEMPKALSVIFEFKFGIWNERRIPSDLRVNNFGYQVAMDNKGLVAVRTSEQEMDGLHRPPLYHLANRIAHSVESWIGHFDPISLVPVDECPTIDADVGVSSDGETIVAVMRCWEGNGDEAVLVIRTFTEQLFGEDDGTLMSIPIAPTYRFSMKLSGDASTMLLDKGDGKVTWMERFNGTWSQAHTLFAMPEEHTPGLAVSEDGSVIGVAGIDTRGLILYKRKGH